MLARVYHANSRSNVVVVMFVYAMLEQYYVVLCLSVCLSVRHKSVFN